MAEIIRPAKLPALKQPSTSGVQMALAQRDAELARLKSDITASFR